MSSPHPHPDSSSEPLLAELLPEPKRSWLSTLAGVAVIVIIVGLVTGPVIYLALPGEINRWRIASAEERRLNGDLAGAIASLDNAISRSPEDGQLLTTRARWRIEQKNYAAALEDANRLVELFPSDEEAYQLRAEIYQYLGKLDAAVADWETIVGSDDMQAAVGRPVALNGLAYARALADRDIDAALNDIDEAMRVAGENFAMIDTRGFLYYRHGEYEKALDDMNLAVTHVEEVYRAWTSENGDEKGFGLPDPRLQAIKTRELSRQVAVLRYHRGLIQAARGEQEMADQDFARIRELGFEPGSDLF